MKQPFLQETYEAVIEAICALDRAIAIEFPPVRQRYAQAAKGALETIIQQKISQSEDNAEKLFLYAINIQLLSRPELWAIIRIESPLARNLLPCSLDEIRELLKTYPPHGSNKK